MRASLQRWINDADTARHLAHFQFNQVPISLAHVSSRQDDYYISLVGELFGYLRREDVPPSDWAQLGNAFLQFSVDTTDDQLRNAGISKDDATLFAAASFYFGDFPASAYLAMRRRGAVANEQGPRAACFDLVARPSVFTSELADSLRTALKDGRLDRIREHLSDCEIAAQLALEIGPQEWIEATLLHRLVARFSQTNLRAVLPVGESAFWTPLVQSLVDRQPPTWEFFPSQIQAIERGLLQSRESFTLQMPTGAGKTTLCETLLFAHLSAYPGEAAILLVPYRSLASELRGTLVRRLNAMGLPARCAYGGTVPSHEEIHGLDAVRAMVATPESISGILSADPQFSQRVSLVICDEGHLLDSSGRGVGLELLLARMKTRPGNRVRFVFVSAIVPNVEEINTWLGGTQATVVQSAYRPAIVEYAVLRPSDDLASINLEMHPHAAADRRFIIDRFLDRHNFRYLNPGTGRTRTYSYRSVKTQTVAAARKLLTMGATAIFAAHKRGAQGAVGLAESLVDQLQHPLELPRPIDFTRRDSLQRCIAYLSSEYGDAWIGARALQNGAVLHHGDIPQESREVLESLVREGSVRLVICTSTLAEGVNLPLRSMILYSVQRSTGAGQPVAMLARDIKNLIGRAGRAGANTRGLVICANPSQWPTVEPVAREIAGEPVNGALVALVRQLSFDLTFGGAALTNDTLEFNAANYSLTDGIDATLIELVSEEVGEDEFAAYARQLAEQTFAAHQLPAQQADILKNVFELRARRLVGLRGSGQLVWIRETGAKVRLLASVDQLLFPARAHWQDPVDALDEGLRTTLLTWAWTRVELRKDIEEIFRADPEIYKPLFIQIVRRWMEGASFAEISLETQTGIDDLLALHTRSITFTLQSVVEQGVSLLTHRVRSMGVEIAPGVAEFVECLRFGAPSAAARVLASAGVRHRRAYVSLGRQITGVGAASNAAGLKEQALRSLRDFADGWRAYLGDLVYANTFRDLS